MKDEAISIAEALVRTKSKEIDLARKFSSGRGGAKTFIDEEVNAKTMSFAIKNTMPTDIRILIGSAANTQFKAEQALLDAVGADMMIADGSIAAGGAGEEVVVTSNDSGRSLNEAIRFFSNSPTRMVSLDMQSSLEATGAPESKNYTSKIKSVFVSPWEKPIEDYLNLRKTQSNVASSPQFASVNFIKEGFKAIVSNENFLVVTVKSGTVLDFTFGVGMQYSKAQEFFRAIKSADTALAPLRRGISPCEG